jgi:hypothetical protein
MTPLHGKSVADFDSEYQAALERELATARARRPNHFQGPPPDAADYQFWLDWLEVTELAPARERARLAVGLAVSE